MIDVNNQLANLESIMKLMREYDIDEVSCDFICIKKSIHLKDKTPTSEEILAKHTTPAPALVDGQTDATKKIAEIEKWLTEGDK
jgi:hypothetical protein